MEGQITQSYDPGCDRLARYFLGTLATERLVKELALHIQRSIETWIENERDRLISEIGSEKVQ